MWETPSAFASPRSAPATSSGAAPCNRPANSRSMTSGSAGWDITALSDRFFFQDYKQYNYLLQNYFFREVVIRRSI